MGLSLFWRISEIHYNFDFPLHNHHDMLLWPLLLLLLRELGDSNPILITFFLCFMIMYTFRTFFSCKGWNLVHSLAEFKQES